MHVVLVHGWFNTGGIMRGFARSLEREGHTCLTPTLHPCDGRGGLPPLAEQLHGFISEFLPDQKSPLALIGFSMGTLVCRHYLQKLGGHARARAFYSLCGPHAGTKLAWLWPSRGARDMRPGSSFLQQLDGDTSMLNGLEIVCYWTPFDLMVRPLASARWSIGQSVRVPSLLHALMPFHPVVRRDVSARLAKWN